MAAPPGQAEVNWAARNTFNAAMPMMRMFNHDVPENIKPPQMVESVNRQYCSRGSGGNVYTVSIKFMESLASSMTSMLGADGTYRTRFLMTRADEGWHAEEVLN